MPHYRLAHLRTFKTEALHLVSNVRMTSYYETSG